MMLLFALEIDAFKSATYQGGIIRDLLCKLFRLFQILRPSTLVERITLGGFFEKKEKRIEMPTTPESGC